MDNQLKPEEEIISLEDEEGNVISFRVLDRITDNGKNYIVLSDEEIADDPDAADDEGDAENSDAAYPDDEDIAGEDDDDEDDGGVMIYRVTERDDGTEDFVPIEDEDELQRIFDYFVSSNEDYEFCDAE